MSPVPPGADISAALLGAEQLGVGLFEQGERVAGLLEARDEDGGALYPEAVVQMPRRSTKTTSIMATVIGRARTREGYRCVITAQSGNIASRILLDHAEAMIRAGHCIESREARSGSTTKAVLYRNGGRERLDFPETGARIWVVPPDAGAVRSAAADDVVVEEAGEHDPQKFTSFLDGVLPLMDTRGPLAQLIVTGTPGKVRAGPFWTMLEAGRAGADERLGVLDYCMRDNEDPADRAVWARVHPGPASIKVDGHPLTPMAVLERRFAKYGPIRFAREYLGHWAASATVSAIDPTDWADRQVPALALPARFGLAADVEPTGAAAAVAAAWRDASGEACVAVLDYKAGTAWVPGYVKQVARKYGRAVAGVAIDGIGANVPVIEALTRARPMVATVQPGFRALQGACQTFAAHLPHHQDQPDLNRAVEAANWREVDGGRLFGRKVSTGDIAPLVACVEALWVYDQKPERRRIRSASSAA